MHHKKQLLGTFILAHITAKKRLPNELPNYSNKGKRFVTLFVRAPTKKMRRLQNTFKFAKVVNLVGGSQGVLFALLVEKNRIQARLLSSKNIVMRVIANHQNPITLRATNAAKSKIKNLVRRGYLSISK